MTATNPPASPPTGTPRAPGGPIAECEPARPFADVLLSSLLEEPAMSDRWHERRTGARWSVVAERRRALEDAGLIPVLSSRVGMDGRPHPAHPEVAEQRREQVAAELAADPSVRAVVLAARVGVHPGTVRAVRRAVSR